jgi:hypothetical protein
LNTVTFIKEDDDEASPAEVVHIKFDDWLIGHERTQQWTMNKKRYYYV